jgi:hypothetical protein
MSREMGDGARGGGGRPAQLSRYTRNILEQRDAVNWKYLTRPRKTGRRSLIYKKLLAASS